MRGRKIDQGRLFYSINVESRIRRNHPLRRVKEVVDSILEGMNDAFTDAYSKTGRPSVPPERLLKSLLLMGLYSIRSERQLAERIDTDLLFRWFLDMNPEEPAFDATVITHNRPRLEKHGLVATFFDAVLRRAIERNLCSDDHFSVDGTLIESCASMKSFRPKEEEDDASSDSNGFKPRNPEVDFHGKKRSNQTHRSRTDEEARLYKKGRGKEAKLAHMGHALTENRNGLVMAVTVSEANGKAECKAALEMLDAFKERQAKSPRTLGADKGYDSGPWYLELESRDVEPHAAMIQTKEPNPDHVRKHRQQSVAARQRMKDRTKTTEYAISQRCRKKSEECFSWIKGIAGLARSRWVGRWKIKQQFELNAAAFNLLRICKLIPT